MAAVSGFSLVSVQKNGFNVVGGKRNGMDVQVEGPVSAVEAAFNCSVIIRLSGAEFFGEFRRGQEVPVGGTGRIIDFFEECFQAFTIA
jgi:hypothetical protein